jgi:uncharacterized membrane protein YhaH (DUF805 family)
MLVAHKIMDSNNTDITTRGNNNNDTCRRRRRRRPCWGFVINVVVIVVILLLLVLVLVLVLVHVLRLRLRRLLRAIMLAIIVFDIVLFSDTQLLSLSLSLSCFLLFCMKQTCDAKVAKANTFNFQLSTFKA